MLASQTATTPARTLHNMPFAPFVPAPVLSVLERLERDSVGFDQFRRQEAESCYRAYAVVAYDPARSVAYIRHDTVNNSNPIYQVDMLTDDCDCPDCRARVTSLNRKRSAAGLLPTLTCKHPMIIALKMDAAFGNDANLLTRALHPRDLSPELRRSIVTNDGYKRSRPITAAQMAKDFD